MVIITVISNDLKKKLHIILFKQKVHTFLKPQIRSYYFEPNFHEIPYL